MKLSLRGDYSNAFSERRTCKGIVILAWQRCSCQCAAELLQIAPYRQAAWRLKWKLQNGIKPLQAGRRSHRIDAVVDCSQY